MIFIKRMETNDDLTYFIERVCDNATRVNKYVIAEAIRLMLNRNLKLKTALVERICTTRLNIFPLVEYMKDATFEKTSSRNFTSKLLPGLCPNKLSTNLLQTRTASTITFASRTFMKQME